MPSIESTQATNRFAIHIAPDTPLCGGILIAEFGDGNYRPVGMVGTICEARDIAAGDMRTRMDELESGQTPECPEAYAVWARGIRGVYHQAERIEP